MSTKSSTTTVRKLINDHREVVIDKVSYTVSDVSQFLGVSYWVAQRLVREGKIRSRNTGNRYIVPGGAILDYLEGQDEPLQHPESA